MVSFVNIYSKEKGEINRFLSKFYDVSSLDINNELVWKKEYNNPIEIAELVGIFIDNFNDYKINMWISLDENIFINVTERNADDIIKYLYERFPY